MRPWYVLQLQTQVKKLIDAVSQCHVFASIDQTIAKENECLNPAGAEGGNEKRTYFFKITVMPYFYHLLRYTKGSYRCTNVVLTAPRKLR